MKKCAWMCSQSRSDSQWEWRCWLICWTKMKKLGKTLDLGCMLNWLQVRDNCQTDCLGIRILHNSSQPTTHPTHLNRRLSSNENESGEERDDFLATNSFSSQHLIWCIDSQHPKPALNFNPQAIYRLFWHQSFAEYHQITWHRFLHIATLAFLSKSQLGSASTPIRSSWTLMIQMPLV